jgi:hypothetical protein
VGQFLGLAAQAKISSCASRLVFALSALRRVAVSPTSSAYNRPCSRDVASCEVGLRRSGTDRPTRCASRPFRWLRHCGTERWRLSFLAVLNQSLRKRFSIPSHRKASGTVATTNDSFASGSQIQPSRRPLSAIGYPWSAALSRLTIGQTEDPSGADPRADRTSTGHSRFHLVFWLEAPMFRKLIQAGQSRRTPQPD